MQNANLAKQETVKTESLYVTTLGCDLPKNLLLLAGALKTL